ncbi:MAG TPA: HAMP domain-containing sensor histidine kinase [Flavisolibacter sp.]|nr:HAMP domain-containing sensor histidine kinase [Flavisolibacter sp.]
MEDFEKRKLGIFNLLNFLGFLIGIFLPIIGMSAARIHLPAFAWVVTFSPAMVSFMVLLLNHYRRHEFGTLCYFIMYPILTALVYQVSFDVGIELFFLLYGVLSVFFLKRFLYIAIAFSLTLFCYFYVFVFTRHYNMVMININFPFYVLNHILPAIFIFYALFLIKKENTQYQFNILTKNTELQRVNLEVQKQNIVIDEKARLLEKQNRLIDEKAKLLQKQTTELSELNSMKNKLFSVISHDLKAPLYALRNLFRGVQQYDVPPEEIKLFIPDVVKDLNYTTALMENLLIWVKSQMQINVLHAQMLEVSELVKEATDLLRLQAHNKEIVIESLIDRPVYIYADKDMISLVIRNLLSNAIKFTPTRGIIQIGIVEKQTSVEVFVKDTGVGMEPEVLKQLFDSSYYSTRGTANETGTGLGLMLCKDFLTKNGGSINITSEPGKGSIFSFSLPRKANI